MTPPTRRPWRPVGRLAGDPIATEKAEAAAMRRYASLTNLATMYRDAAIRDAALARLELALGIRS